MRVIHTSRRHASGYTMVEILVASSLATVLAALGFSGYHHANQSAASAHTLGQLREVGAGSAMWSADHAAQIPPAWDNTEGRNRSYAQVLDPYVHGVEAYRKSDSKFIGANKRLPLRITPYSHPITFSLNRSVARDVTRYGDRQETPISMHSLHNPSEIIFAVDGCQNPRNLNQANASTYELFFAIGDTGPQSGGNKPIPLGPDEDSAVADGWIRYPGGQATALMCDGSARTFPKGSIRNRNIWRAFQD